MLTGPSGPNHFHEGRRKWGGPGKARPGIYEPNGENDPAIRQIRSNGGQDITEADIRARYEEYMQRHGQEKAVVALKTP
jgi:hypothetical protein